MVVVASSGHHSVCACNCVDRKQASLWAAGREYRQGNSTAAGNHQPDGCLVTVVSSLSLDDNQNCETPAVTVDDNDNMACRHYVSTVAYPVVLCIEYFVCITVDAGTLALARNILCG